METVAGYVFDPEDPRAPTVEQWQAMTEQQRARVVDMLPSEFPPDEAHPPEGDRHYDIQSASRSLLRKFFQRTGRRIYVAGNMAVFCPGTRMFSPDLYAVTGVDVHERNSWVVLREGNGLDLALEINVTGRRIKDLKTNVERYARLGIREYFVLDVRKQMLRGWRLPADGSGRYEGLMPQLGVFRSEVLGLELTLVGVRLRFIHDNAVVEDAEELVERLTQTLNDSLAAREDEAKQLVEAQRHAEEEAQRAEDEEQRRQEAERRLAEALAELERLKGGRH